MLKLQIKIIYDKLEEKAPNYSKISVLYCPCFCHPCRLVSGQRGPIDLWARLIGPGRAEPSRGVSNGQSKRASWHERRGRAVAIRFKTGAFGVQTYPPVAHRPT